MIAMMHKHDQGYTARFERHFDHAPAEVWAYLSENDKLKQWFAELHIEELRTGGTILFDMHDGTFEIITITAYEEGSLLEFTWAEDRVRFELSPEAYGTQLVMTEQIHRVTPHTPRDLAGWHVCLDVISALLDERTIASRQELWNGWYSQYVEAVEATVANG